MVKFSKVIHAVIGIVFNNSGQFLLTQRRADQSYAGYWEFPGGKVEANESIEQSLIREMKEELNITITGYKYHKQISHEYPEYVVNLEIFEVTSYLGEPIGFEGQNIKWSTIDCIDSLDKILPASDEILACLSNLT